MKKSQFSEEQIAYALRQVESGTPVGGSVSVAGDGKILTGGGLAAKGPLGAFHNETLVGASIGGTTNVYDHVKSIWNGVKDAVKDIVSGAERFALAPNGI